MSIGPLISEEFQVEGYAVPGAMQHLWATGWRHFGRMFFRYNLTLSGAAIQHIVPLRVDLKQFHLSKSQRRVLRKNADVTCIISGAEITDELHEMFQRHKGRFKDNVPDSLHSFLADDPSAGPCECLMVKCLLDGQCVAASYFDVDQDAISSVYGLFDPEFGSRSLGLLTMLLEMEWAVAQGKQWYYPGYATLEASHYDYKKQFSGLQGYDWSSDTWMPYEAMQIDTEGRAKNQNESKKS